MRPSRKSPQVKRRSLFEQFEERLALSAQPIGDVLLGDGLAPPVEHHYGELAPIEAVSPVAAAPDFRIDTELEQRIQPEVGDLTSQLSDVHDTTGLNYVYNTFGLDGTGQTVAVVDSGIAYDHYALGGGFGSGYRVVGGYDFAENDADPYDDASAGFHGTHVAGIVGSSNSTYRGTAPGVDLVGLRVFDDDGAGYFSWVESALQWIHTHRNDYANPITTVNLSLGTPSWNSDSVPSWAMLEDEFAQLKSDGIFVSVSAGNAFQDFNAPGVSYPAASTYVVPVASVNNDGTMSSFSQRNSRVLAAPGSGITSTVPDHKFGADGDPNDFGTASGTSMAAPYVAGVSAVVRQAMQFVGYQSVTQDTIYDHLRNTADVFFDSATNANYHRIDVQAALDALMPDDDYGSSTNTAHSLGTLSSNTSFNGTIGTLSDSDYFTFTAGTTGAMSFTANVTHALAPSWEVSGGGGQVSGNSNEVFSFDVTAGQTYTVGLDSSDGIGHYTMNVGIQANAPVLTTSGNALAYQENDSSAAIDAALQIQGSAPASSNYIATIRVSQNYHATQDVLSFSDTAKITGSSANGVLTLRVATGSTATLADFQTALRSVKYQNSSEDPSGQARTVEFSFGDGTQVTSATTQVNVTAVNDAPVLASTANAISYTENDSATAIDTGLSIADVDNQGASAAFQATVQISSNFASGEDVLSFSNSSKINGSLNGSTLTLTVASGQQATLAEFQTALHSVSYHNTSEDPSTATRTVTFGFSDGSLAAVATRQLEVVAVADDPDPVQIMDNGDAGFATTGSWFRYVGMGQQNDLHYSASGSGSSVASWTFDVDPGVYRVSSTWVAHQNRASDAPFSVMDGSQMVGHVDANQESLTGDLIEGGITWQDLGQVDITGESLVVQLTDQANQYVIADAVRIERVGDVVVAPEIVVLDGSTNIADSGTVNFGSAQPGVAVDKVLTVKNIGNDNLTLTPLAGSSFPAGFSLVQNFGSTDLAAGASTTFTVRMQSSSEASLLGAITFANNDSDEGPFDISLQGTVASTPPAPPAPAVQIKDNGDAGFAATGSWKSYVGQGHDNDVHYAAAGSGSSVASWTFDVDPGVYRVSSTWWAHQNRASDAPFSILDGSQLVGQVDVNQETLKSDLVADGTTWQHLGQFTITGETLVVQLSDQANQYIIADAVRIERVGAAVQSPEIQVTDGSTNIADSGTVNFGSAQPGVAVDKVLTVKNIGTQNLTLTPLAGSSFPAGFSLVQNFGSTDLAAGASTTFTVRMQSSSEASLSGAITFANNDSDEGPFDISLQGTVASTPPAPPAPAVQIKDNGDAGFAATGTWKSYVGHGHDNDVHYAAAGSGSSVASWTFDVDPGVYRVSSTWWAHQNRASDAPFSILDGSQLVGQVDVNQETLKSDLVADGTTWQHLGQFTITGETLVVQLSDQANQYIIADAVRIERVGAAVQSPEIQVTDGSTNIADSGTVNFGSAQPGVAVDKVLTVKNIGNKNLTLTPLAGSSFPTGFSLVQNFGSTDLAAGASTTFTVRMQSSSEASLSGAITFANNDSDEGPFDITLQGTVASTPPAPPAPAVQIKDNGDAGFAATGSWKSYVGQGHDNDVHYAAAGSGSSVASWTFDVDPGVYRVSSTWWAHQNRASDAPFSILDGSQLVGQVDVNQETLKSDLVADGTTWQHLGQFTITGETLVVQLSDQANQYIIADAVRIERVGAAVQSPEIQVTDGSTNIADSGTVNFGSAQPGVAVDKVLTVTNVGTQNLTLTPLAGSSFPTGFSLVQNFGSTDLAAGASTTFTVRMQSSSEASLSGAITFANNDSDEGPFDITLQGTVASTPPAPAVQVVDNGEEAFSATSSWKSYAGRGHHNDLHYIAAGTGSNVVSWTFDVDPGVYRVSSTWWAHQNRASDAPFSILDGTQLIEQVDVSQETLKSDLVEDGTTWQHLGQFTVTGNTLVVKLSDQANQYVIADAVRIERLSSTQTLGSTVDTASVQPTEVRASVASSVGSSVLPAAGRRMVAGAHEYIVGGPQQAAPAASVVRRVVGAHVAAATNHSVGNVERTPSRSDVVDAVFSRRDVDRDADDGQDNERDTVQTVRQRWNVLASSGGELKAVDQLFDEYGVNEEAL